MLVLVVVVVVVVVVAAAVEVVVLVVVVVVVAAAVVVVVVSLELLLLEQPKAKNITIIKLTAINNFFIINPPLNLLNFRLIISRSREKNKLKS